MTRYFSSKQRYFVSILNYKKHIIKFITIIKISYIFDIMLKNNKIKTIDKNDYKY